MRERHLVLVGLPGAGKSTVGPLVAAELVPRKGLKQQFVTTSAGWAFLFERTPGVIELNHVEFAPR